MTSNRRGLSGSLLVALTMFKKNLTSGVNENFNTGENVNLQRGLFRGSSETYHGGENYYRPAFFISTSSSGKNNRDPAKDP